MLGGEDNENGEKTTIGLISKKQLSHVQYTFLYISLPLLCMTTTWNFQKLPGYTFYAENVVRVLVPFFSLSLILTLVAASISLFLITATNFHVVPLTNSVSFVFPVSRSTCSSRWASLACPLLSLFLCLSQFLYFPNLWTWQLIQA